MITLLTAMKVTAALSLLALLLKGLFTPEDPHAPPRR